MRRRLGGLLELPVIIHTRSERGALSWNYFFMKLEWFCARLQLKAPPPGISYRTALP
jgi:hypothetical protein